MIFYEGDRVAWTEPGTGKTREATVVGKVDGFPEVYFLNTKTENGMQRCVTAQPNEIKKLNIKEKE